MKRTIIQREHLSAKEVHYCAVTVNVKMKENNYFLNGEVLEPKFVSKQANADYLNA